MFLSLFEVRIKKEKINLPSMSILHCKQPLTKIDVNPFTSDSVKSKVDKLKQNYKLGKIEKKRNKQTVPQ